MNSDSVYDDGQGGSWHIGELLGSARPRTVRTAIVDTLLTPLLDAERWGERSGTPREAIIFACRDDELRDLPEPQREHVLRVRELVAAVDSGFEPQPVVIGLDGTLWDGIHRLCCYTILGRTRCTAVDFSSSFVVDDALWSITLADVLSPEWIRPDPLKLQAHFWGATGYPRFFLDGFLASDFATYCLGELRRLSGWHRATASFYLQDEYVLKASDLAVGPTLRRLASALKSPAMAAWLEAATGHVGLSRPEVVAHRMRPGDYVGFHNDFRVGGERLRGVIYLEDEARSLEDGAFIAMGDDQRDVLAVVPPVHNRMLIFRTSTSSNHLVTEVQGPDRFSVNFGWYQDD